MRVAVITYDFYPIIGGQGRHVFELWKRFQEDQEIEIHVFSPCENELARHHSVFRACRHRGRNLSFSILMSLSLKRWAHSYHIDLFHLQGGPGGLPLLFRRPDKPILYTVHHTYAQQYQLVPGQRWKRALSLLERRSYLRTDRFTADSSSTKQSLVEHYQVDPEKVEVLPTGIDRTFFRPLGLPRIPDSLLFVGRLDERKGVKFLLKAMADVHREMASVHLYIAGAGKLRRSLERYVKHHDLDRSVTFLGFISDDDLVRWYNRAQVVVIPSVFEGFGLTAIEALACGTPVIATRTAGLQEIIRDGENGRLVRYGDVEGLADAVTATLRNLDAAKRMAERSAAEVRNKYDWDSIAMELRGIYMTTLG